MLNLLWGQLSVRNQYKKLGKEMSLDISFKDAVNAGRSIYYVLDAVEGTLQLQFYLVPIEILWQKLQMNNYKIREA